MGGALAPPAGQRGRHTGAPAGKGGQHSCSPCRLGWKARRALWWVWLPLTHLFSCTSWMFSMPMALLRREPNGPDFFLVGLFPGTIRDCGERLSQCLLALESQWPHLPLGPCHRAQKPTGYEQERRENVLSGGLPDRRAGPQRARAAPENTQQGCAGH